MFTTTFSLYVYDLKREVTVIAEVDLSEAEAPDVYLTIQDDGSDVTYTLSEDDFQRARVVAIAKARTRMGRPARPTWPPPAFA